MDLTKADEQLVKITLYYKVKDINGFQKVIILEDEKAKEILEDEKAKEILEDENKKADVNELNTWWKVLSWQDSNNITNASRVTGEKAMPGELDFYRFRDLRIKTCMKKWDLKDDNNADIPLTPEIINKLPVEVVGSLANKYETLMNMTEEELGN